MKLSGVGQFRLERAARAGLQHCPQCRAQGRDRRGQARTHTLKHTGVPHLVQPGVPLVMVQQYAGHRDYRSTLYYAGVSTEQVDKATFARS